MNAGLKDQTGDQATQNDGSRFADDFNRFRELRGCDFNGRLSLRIAPPVEMREMMVGLAYFTMNFIALPGSLRLQESIALVPKVDLSR